MALLDVQGLTKHFGGLPALVDLDLAVEPGTITALVGPNGAGKSTALGCIAGLLRPTSCARMELGGVDLRRRPPDAVHTRGLALVTQRPRVFTSMTAADDVAVGALASAATRADARARAVQTLDELRSLSGDTPEPVVTVESLNIHQRRMVALARALAGSPRVLLIDEPMAGLGPVEVSERMALITAIVGARGLAVVLVEHVLSAVAGLADHVVVLDHGQTIAAGPPDDVFVDDRVRRAYLGDTSVDTDDDTEGDTDDDTGAAGPTPSQAAP